MQNKIYVTSGFPNLIRCVLFDIFMYADKADDTLLDCMSNWQDTLSDKEMHEDLNVWIKVLGKKFKRMDLVKKMYKRRKSSIGLTLKIKDAIADIFDLIDQKKLSQIITNWRTVASDKETWEELEKSLNTFLIKKEKYYHEHPGKAMWVSADGTLFCDNLKILYRRKQWQLKRKKSAKEIQMKRRAKPEKYQLV